MNSRLLTFAALFSILTAWTCTVAEEAFASESVVYVIRVEGLIDNGLNMYIDRGISAAEQDDSAVGVILHMDTFGGLVDAADKIRKRLLDAEIPVVTFIDPNAASAGALISFASNTIFMAPGGSIGAATVVDGTGEKADEKLQSYMRGLMRSTAEARGYDPAIAEAMVDERIEIEGVIAEGELLTLSASEALELGISTATVRSKREIKEEMGWEDATLFNIDERWEESVIRFFGSPVLQSILMLMMLGGLYFELQSPGVGFAGAVAGVGALLFFLPLYIMGLVQFWEVAIIVIGIGLIVVELFILPGFGIAGVSGAVLLIFGLFASLVGNVGFSFPPVEHLRTQLWTILVTLMLTIAFIASTMRYVMKTPLFGRLVLTRSTDRDSGYTSYDDKQDLLGQEGITLTPLRISGTVRIGDKRVDVVSDGSFIDKNVRVKVISVAAGQVIVAKAGDE
ncbi:NfeD family protein [Balneolaceae bacterium ANBcel3]|nr:NfeD family protein [Balneolaceae bacterium ANBcel3]